MLARPASAILGIAILLSAALPARAQEPTVTIPCSLLKRLSEVEFNKVVQNGGCVAGRPDNPFEYGVSRHSNGTTLYPDKEPWGTQFEPSQRYDTKRSDAQSLGR